MSLLSEIAPKVPLRLIDLVSSAGVDVRDWGNFKGGQAKAASNPTYCYEWSFVEPGKVVVLNLWHASMQEHNGVVVRQMNMRKRAQQFGSASKKAVWERRALKMDEAIQVAYKDRVPVRAIICEGEMRNPNDSKAKASRVKKRLLDSMPWAVTAYNWNSGECTITRGAAPESFIDQFSLPDHLPGKTVRHSKVFNRSHEVRRRVLARAEGKCEWCSQSGFIAASGGVYLETHHVIPLSEGGSDTVANVVALCPNHHMEAHHGSNGPSMRKQLLERLSDVFSVDTGREAEQDA